MSENDLVSVIYGCGPAKQKLLLGHGITTVGQLVNADISTITDVPGLASLVSRALERLQKPSDLQKSFSFIPKKEEEEEPVELQYMFESHSWYEQKVNLPYQKTLFKFIIYDLNLEPTERVSLICQSMLNDDQVVSVSFSPQLIFHFNPTLEKLTVDIKPEDFEKISSRKHVLKNTIDEIDTMHEFYNKPESIL